MTFLIQCLIAPSCRAPGRRPANGLLIRHHGNAQITGAVNMLPHVICPDGSVDIELLAGLQKPQGHLLDFLSCSGCFGSVMGGNSRCGQMGISPSANTSWAFCRANSMFFFHIAPQRSTDKHQLRAVLRPFRRSLPKHGQILPNGLTQRVVIRSAGMIDIPVYIAMIIPQVGA